MHEMQMARLRPWSAVVPLCKHVPLPLHVCLRHSSMLFAQLTPFHPNAHTHEYALTAWVQFAPFWHGGPHP